MSRAPKLKRSDGRYENVQDECGRTNDCRRQSEQRHRRDVTGRARVPDRRIEKRDHRDRETKENEMGRIHFDLRI